MSRIWVHLRSELPEEPIPASTLYVVTEADLESCPEGKIPPAGWKGSDRQWRRLVVTLERSGLADFQPILQEAKPQLLCRQREMIGIFSELINRGYLILPGKRGAVGFLLGYFVNAQGKPLSKGALDQAAFNYHHHLKHGQYKAVAVRIVLSLQES